MNLWVGIAFFAAVWLLAAWNRGVIGGRRDREKAALGFARRAGLPVDDPPDADLVDRVVRRHRFVVGGAFAGFVAGFFGPDSFWSWPALIYVGLAAGAVLARLTEDGLPPDSPRVAHATETRISDYVPTWIVPLVPAAAGAAVALAAYVLAVRGSGPPPPPADAVLWPAEWFVSDTDVVVAAVTAVAVAVLSGLLARLVVSRRRAAGSTAALATDDALRASAVRDCLQLSAAVTFSAVGTISLALAEPMGVEGVARRVGGWAPGVLLVALVVVHLTFDATRGARWWRRRLHPVPA